ncbi:MAG: tetratricopeptide repeat protein [Candidatus Lokiarchaeota archaeon]|nr:tetratricopeptide repeat protein [Candidatus Lokiarchaeota archaeon]
MVNNSKSFHNNIETLISVGKSLFKKGHLFEAGEKFYKAIKLDGKCHEAWFYLGIINYKIEKINQSKICFEEYLKMNTKHHIPFYYLGKIYFELDDFELAKEMFEKVFQLKPDFIDVLSKYPKELKLFNKMYNQIKKHDKIRNKLKKERPFSNPLLYLPNNKKFPYKAMNELAKRTHRKKRVNSKSTNEEIHSLYKELAEIFHPDRNDVESEELIKYLNNTYDEIKKRRDLT